MVIVGRFAKPTSRTAHPAFTSLATFRAMKLAIAPPEVRRPPAEEGSPNWSANHRTRASSIWVAAGERRHPPTFWLMAAAMRSAAAPGTVPGPLMYPMNRGCPGYVECSRTTARR
jgi:hypothetical protein